MKTIIQPLKPLPAFLAVLIYLLFIAACAPVTSDETTVSGLLTPDTGSEGSTTATARPTETAVPTQTPTPAPSSTPTATATAAPLTPAGIFKQISPSIFFIETLTGTGSGVLLEGGYILTNAHVVWPFDKARVVSSDGAEYTEAPVVETDLMADLALLGPVEEDAPAIKLSDGENLIIGSTLYLIGYPGEVEKFPEPTITQGILSRKREWEVQGISYFQTDATIAGGQSGGVLVSEYGDVIGISGRSFSAGEFGLVASAIDLQPRVEGLIAGENVDHLRGRLLDFDRLATKNYTETIYNPWSPIMFYFREPAGTEVEIEVNGDGDLIAMVLDGHGNIITMFDESLGDLGIISMKTESDAPYFLVVYSDFAQSFKLKSSIDLIKYYETDDSRSLKMDQTVTGRIDYPGDVDYFKMTLDKDQTVHIKTNSTMIDPLLIVSYDSEETGQDVEDDDSGGGMLGWNAEMVYKAPQKDVYFIVIRDTNLFNMGGYTLSVDEPGAAAPTPMAPLPTPTPIVSDLGEMRRHVSEGAGFSIEYPATLKDASNPDLSRWGRCEYGACYADNQVYMGINVDDISHLGEVSLTDLSRIVSNFYGENDSVQTHGFALIQTVAGEAMVTRFSLDDGAIWLQYFTFLRGDTAVSILYFYPAEDFAEEDLRNFPELRELQERDLEAMIAHSFASFSLNE